MDDKKLLTMAQNFDGWANLMTGLGSTLRDRRMSTTIDSPSELVQQDLEDLFAGNGLARKICLAPPQHMFREWMTVTAPDVPDLAERVQDRIDELQAIRYLIETLGLARLHGGAAIFLGADDGQDPVQPLNEDRIQSLNWLTILDRWQLCPERYYTDPLRPKFGEPEVYSVAQTYVSEAQMGATARIHETRLIRFDGLLTTQLRRTQNNSWSDSVFVSLLEELRGYGHVVSACESLVTDFAQAVYKYKGLAEVMAAKGTDLIEARAQVLNIMRSVLGVMVLDADGEDFERKQTPVTGLPELWDRFQITVSAAADIPATVLFGRSPAGENATGDSDMRNWYDRITSDRRMYAEPQVERLVKLLLLAKDGPTNGVEPESWRVTWRPLWQQSEADMAKNRMLQARTDEVYINTGVLSAADVAQSRFGTGTYSMETRVTETPVPPADEK